MSELIDIHEPDDRIYTISAKGEVRVYLVKADGRLKLVQGNE